MTTTPASTTGTPEVARADVEAAVAALAGAHLAHIVATDSPVTMWRVAGSPWLTPATAETLAHDASDVALTELAANPATPGHVLTRLASQASSDRSVRYAATHNPTCPYDVAEAYGFPTAALTHPDCPADRLAAAVHDPELRPATLAHPSTPWEAIAAVRHTLTLAEQVTLLRNPRMTQSDAAGPLAALAAHARLGVDAPATWARHPNADPSWLAETAHAQLAQQSRGVRRESADAILTAIARNHVTAPDTLTRIADGQGVARTAALGNPHCPTGPMHRALAYRLPPRGSGATGTSSFEFSELAANPAADATALSTLYVADLPDLLTHPTSTRRTIYNFAQAHARTGQHARVILGLADTWTLSLHELLDAAADVTQ